MRVLIVNKFARVRGGADRHCLELFDALSDAGHQVAFLSTAGPGNRALPGAFVPGSVTAEDRGALGAVAAQRAARRCLWNTTAAAATHRLIDDFAPDVVHLHKLYPQLSAAPAVVAARRQIPVVQTLHDYELLAGLAFDDGEFRPPPGPSPPPIEHWRLPCAPFTRRCTGRRSTPGWRALTRSPAPTLGSASGRSCCRCRRQPRTAARRCRSSSAGGWCSPAGWLITREPSTSWSWPGERRGLR